MTFRIPILTKIFDYFSFADKPPGGLTRSQFFNIMLTSCTVNLNPKTMDNSWLQKKVTTKIARSKFRDNNEILKTDSALFDFENYDWEHLKSDMKVGDELWTYSSPEKTWENLCGRGGVCIVRDGKIIKSVLMVMS